MVTVKKKRVLLFYQELLWRQRQVLEWKRTLSYDLGKLPPKRSSDSENTAHSSCNTVTNAVHLLRVKMM